MAGFGSVPTVGGGGKGPVRADEIDYLIRGHEMQFVEIELDPGESAVAEAGAHDVQGRRHRDGHRVRRRLGAQGGGFFGKLLRRRQAPAHRREPVHDRVHAHTGTARREWRSPRPIPARSCRWTCTELRRHADLPEGRFLCAAQGVSIGIAFQQQDHRPACSAAKASSCRSSRATASSSCTSAAR